MITKGRLVHIAAYRDLGRFDQGALGLDSPHGQDVPTAACVKPNRLARYVLRDEILINLLVEPKSRNDLVFEPTVVLVAHTILMDAGRLRSSTLPTCQTSVCQQAGQGRVLT